MKRAIGWFLTLVLPAAVASAQGNNYVYSEDLSNPTWSNWSTEGSIQSAYYYPGSFGGIYSTSTGVMYNCNAGQGTGAGEIRAVVRYDPNNATGAVLLYLGAVGDVLSYSVDPSGDNGINYVQIQIAPFGTIYVTRGVTLGTFDPSTGQFNYSFSTYSLASGGVTMHDGLVIRAMYTSSGQILVYADGNLVVSDADPYPANWASWGCSVLGASGNASSYSSPSGFTITHADLGTTDTTAPSAIPTSSIGISAFTNHIDMQWPAASDNTNGSGVFEYQLYRGGQLIYTTQSNLSFSDTAGIVPNQIYSYTLTVVDYFQNTASTSFSVQTPHVPTKGPFPSVTPDGRRVGIRTTGAYWGGGNENIDVMSGNLNFTLPLLRAQSRTGSSVPFNLVYNSQNWRQDSGGAWQFGADVGYGFGWKLLAGSITPVWNPGGFTAAYYLFADATGAEYRLDQNNGNVWSSTASVYVYFDANTNILHFRDGSFWSFQCISAASEADSGVMHPTLMEDTNGNQIIISYQQSPGASWANSSSRITIIEDVRAQFRNFGWISGTMTFLFQYNSDSTPHLTNIYNVIGTGEAYNFTYSGGQAISSPINGQSFGTTTLLSSAVVSGLNATHTFTYDGSGQLAKVVMPYNGYLAYDYHTTTYSNSVSYTEVGHRYLSADGTTGSQLTYPIAHESNPSANVVHQFTTIDDPSGNGEKFWAFGTTGVATGLATQYQGRQLPGPVTKTQNDFTWAQDSIGNSYIATNLTTLDPGQTYQAQKKTTQTVDTYGNPTQVQYFDFGNLSSPARTLNYTYTSSPSYSGASQYTSRYIFNRLVSDGINSYTIDSYSQGIAAVSGAREFDTNYGTGFGWRGNVTQATTPGGTSTMNYDQTGAVVSMTTNGVSVQVSNTSTTNFAAPSQLTVGNQTTSLTWSSFLGLSTDTGPNGDSSSVLYDQYARQSSTTSPFGAMTGYAYSNPPYSSANPPTVMTTLNGFTRQTLDGLGHTILTETGDSNGTKSQAESVYGPCACSPMLKLMKQAMRHTVGATPVWTVYSYDGIGRTTNVVAPDGASTTAYLYQGNTVKVTDPAGKWKLFTMDAFGNLTKVTEPDPANPASLTYITTYTYDVLNHLTGVSMPRPTGTQTRSFAYSGNYLTSATNPENGTVSYTYNLYNKVATKTDAKGQVIVYSYDGFTRLTKVQRYPQGTSNAEDTCQQENYYYDTNPFDSTYSGSYTTGRLTAVQYYGGTSSYQSYGSPGACDTQFIEMYSYSQAGGKTGKRLRVMRQNVPWSGHNPSSGNVTADLNSTYTFDNEGRLTAVQYPAYGPSGSQTSGPNLGWAFDTVGRLNTMTDLAANASIISGATYGPSNELLTMSGNVTETRTYNVMLQLTHLVNGAVNVNYNYSSSQNNGKITSQADNLSGEQVTYAYDVLNRLASATSGSWGQSYAYDGFGNLTDQNVTAGSAPAYHVVPDPATNHLGTTDANGNSDTGLTCGSNVYDVENRLSSQVCGNFRYSYAPDNKRVWRGVGTPGSLTTDEVTFWSISGQKLATYSLTVIAGSGSTGPTMTANQTGTNYYFGGKLIKNAGGYVGADRLGSIGKYYPYGQEKPSATMNGTEKFTGLLRDSETGLDYADQRYHNPGTGRFLTPDPYRSSGGPSDPSSWNRYAYVNGDPVNFVDPQGTTTCTWVLGVYLVCSDSVTVTAGQSGPGSGPGEELNGANIDLMQMVDNGPDNGNGDDGGGGFVAIGTIVGKEVITNLQRSKAVDDAYTKLKQALANDPKCANWLATNSWIGGSENVGSLIDTEDSLTLAGAFSDPAGAAALTYVDSHYAPQLAPGTAATIFVGTNSLFFNDMTNSDGTYKTFATSNGPTTIHGGTTAAQMLILLHETVHFIQVRGFVGDDSGDSGAAINSALLANCSKTIFGK